MVRSVRNVVYVHVVFDDDLYRLRHHVGVIVSSLIPEYGAIANDESSESCGGILREKDTVVLCDTVLEDVAVWPTQATV